MSFLFGKKVNTTTAADKIAAFQSTTCDFGTPLPLCFGTCKRSPNLINYQDFYAQEIKKRQKTGKRSSATTIDYKYYAYIELALCEGPIEGISRVWVGDKEYASLAAFNANENNEGSPLSLETGVYASPTTYMSENHPDIAVGYNSMAYLYGYVYLGENNASIPSYSFEVLGMGRSNGLLDLDVGGDGVDVNPADVIYYLLNEVGYGNYIDYDSLTDYRSYCWQANLLVSVPQDAFTSQQKCQEVIKSLLALTNTYMFWSEHGFKFVPRDDRSRDDRERGGSSPSRVVTTRWWLYSWSPDTTPVANLTPNEMAVQSDGACVIYEIKDSSEIYNRFGVTFTSRENNYEPETVYYEDTDDIAINGIRSAPDVDGKWLHTLDRAVTVAEMQARINRTETIRYTFSLSWCYSWLEPGDLVTLTDPVIGLDQQMVMIDSVTENADETLTITALRREGSPGGTISYDSTVTDTPTYNKIDNNEPPGNTRAPIIFAPPAELANASNLEVWIAVQGQSKAWGGCNVYVSTKDGDYELAATHNRNSNYGKILTAMTADSTTVDVEFSNVNTVNILAGSAQDAADGNTDLYIGGEFCAYTAATLIGTNQYRLTLVRGKYGSTAAAHAINTGFALMDGDLLALTVPKSYAGKTTYLKFPAFNTVGSMVQDTAAVGYYTYTLPEQGYTDAYVEEEIEAVDVIDGGTA